MKKILFFFLVFFFAKAPAQLRLSMINNDVSNSLSKVIEDFPNNFNSIRGDVISKDIQATIYSSSVNVPNADSSTIIQNGKQSDNIFSWKEIVFETDDFDKAKAKFHEYFSKIKPTGAVVDGKRITLHGDYDEPTTEKKFATVLFDLKPETQALKDVVVDLSLQYLLSGWQISISVYEHKDYGVEENSGNN